MPALIYDSYARRILCAAASWGGYFAHREQTPPQHIWGTNLKLLNSIIFPPPLHDFGLQHQVRKPPLPNPSFSYEDIDPEVCGLDQTTWELMCAGEAAMRKSIPALRQAG